MFKVTTTWKNLPPWNPDRSTMQHLIEIGGLVENVKFGAMLITELVDLNSVKFIKSTPEELASGISWKTELIFPGQTELDVYLNYVNTRLTEELSVLDGGGVEVAVETYTPPV